MDFPLLSIITSVYNGNEDLYAFFDSIFNQTYPNIEIIIVDDGSSNSKTLEILKELEEGKLYDKPFKLIKNNKNLGLLAAFQNGLDIATGKYFAFPESDDYIDYDFYENLMNVAINKDADIVRGLMLCHHQTKENVSNHSDVIEPYDSQMIEIRDYNYNLINYIMCDFAYSYFFVFNDKILKDNSENKLLFENAVLYASNPNLYNKYKEYKVSLATASFYHFIVHDATKFTHNTMLTYTKETVYLLNKMLDDSHELIKELTEK